MSDVDKVLNFLREIAASLGTELPRLWFEIVLAWFYYSAANLFIYGAQGVIGFFMLIYGLIGIKRNLSIVDGDVPLTILVSILVFALGFIGLVNFSVSFPDALAGFYAPEGFAATKMLREFK